MSSPAHNTIGWIGLGQMGNPMVTRLLAHNINVSIYNRSPDKTSDLKQKGAYVCESITQLLQNNETIFLMVSDYAAISDIFNPQTYSLLAGKTIINMSTVSPAENIAIQTLIKTHGGQFAEAPVSGSVLPATHGNLLILFGGEEKTLTTLQDIFNILGKQTFYFGAVGKASGAKLVLNALLGIFSQAYSEAMIMAQQFNIDTTTIIEAIGESAMNSPMFQTKQSLWANQEFPAAFMLKHANKDLNLACTSLKDSTQLPTLHTVTQHYQAAVKSGLGEQDVAAIYLQLLNPSA